jgi:hypothetical protein
MSQHDTIQELINQTKDDAKLHSREKQVRLSILACLLLIDTPIRADGFIDLNLSLKNYTLENYEEWVQTFKTILDEKLKAYKKVIQFAKLTKKEDSAVFAFKLVSQ